MALPNLSQISEALAEMLPKLKPLSVPTGMISAFHTVPEGWLQCNGAAVSRTTYAALFAVIGTKYGSGDGSTTFNLPNLHHRFLEGTTTTSEVGYSVEAGLPNIIGNLNSFPVWKGSSGTESFSLRKGDTAHVAGGNGDMVSGSLGYNASFVSSVYGKSATNQPPSLRLLPCIKI